MSSAQNAVVKPAPHRGLGRYRADIDGLRAIAVLLVVLNHLQFRHFEGGYVGVDVFFVISGYLIGASLIAEFRDDRFSLAAFYERRIRRIFPALLAMLIVVSLLCYCYLMPASLVDYARSVVAALLSVSNFLFWSQAGYFDAPSSVKPLLHTWSLAVEEQFYVVFPIVLFVIYRWRPAALRKVLWGLTILTLALSAWIVRRDASMAFFWSPLRAWELITGVMVSQYGFAWMKRRMVRELTAWAGLLLILVPGVLYTAATPFPGLTAILPCAGAALILASGQVGGSTAGALLITPPARFIGLISYSLYLWHWPVLVLQNSALLISPHPSWERNTKLTILIISLVLATLSWWLVETPFRKGSLKLARRPLMAWSGAVSAAIVLAAVAVLLGQGYPSRFPVETARIGAFMNYNTTGLWRTGVCFIGPQHSFIADFKPDVCLDSIPGKKNYLLFGDSTAASLYPGLVRIFPEIHIQEATSASCLHYDAASGQLPGYARNCDALWHFLHEQWLPVHHPDAIILEALWTPEHLADLAAEIKRFQQMGIRVIVFGASLNFDQPVPILLTSEMRRHESAHVRSESLTSHLELSGRRLDNTMAHLAANTWKVTYVSYWKELCRDQIEDVAKSQIETSNGCPLITNSGDPLMFDTHHLTAGGSEQFATAVRRDGLLP